MVQIPEKEGKQLVRKEIFKILKKYEVSGESAVKILNQCSSYIVNCEMIENAAREIGISLKNFRTDKVLELYYDIEKDGSRMAYISKGWNDPGLRVGEVLTMPEHLIDVFSSKAAEILNFCSTNGVLFNARYQNNDMEVRLEVCIYQEGFNTAVFTKTLQAVVACVSKISHCT